MQGSVRQCQDGQGKAVRGEVWYGLASTFLNVGVGVFGARYGELLCRVAWRGAVRCGKAGYGEVRRGPVWQGATSKANRFGSGFDKRNVCVSMFSVVTDPTTKPIIPDKGFRPSLRGSAERRFFIWCINAYDCSNSLDRNMPYIGHVRSLFVCYVLAGV
jgi:hypothetical protein